MLTLAPLVSFSIHCMPNELYKASKIELIVEVCYSVAQKQHKMGHLTLLKHVALSSCPVRLLKTSFQRNRASLFTVVTCNAG